MLSVSAIIKNHIKLQLRIDGPKFSDEAYNHFHLVNDGRKFEFASGIDGLFYDIENEPCL